MSISTASKTYNVVQIEGRHQSTLTPQRSPFDLGVHTASSTTRSNFKSIVSRFLTWRGGKGGKEVAMPPPPTPVKQIEVKRGEAQSVPRPRVLWTREKRTEMAHYRKCVFADLDNRLAGGGRATGNGDGDMSGVWMKDFAYPLAEVKSPEGKVDEIAGTACVLEKEKSSELKRDEVANKLEARMNESEEPLEARLGAIEEQPD